ncbi:glycosyltransferase family 4 protein [Corynebacterium fournieri]|uniref:glycosyltransferase family 4 protein n=1 Tax=Corynebacterium fournieri TaxID=1852390 RepID=UPI0015C49A45|nr:glycosyltransferase family 4 protein [Corynebacterium fournieri]WJY97941.1 GDP-mannose-dependent alpha-(1-6)-phosphatidylinositol monomannoside mannosyltransferase [Corynebacterium fournieri]
MPCAIKTLLVTNDFPPTVGGIQSYLRDFAAELVRRDGPDSLVVFASTQDSKAAGAWDSSVPYTVVRWPRRVMLPTPATVREMQRLIRAHNIDTVWFGAAAPLGIMGAAAKRAGAKHVVATTHGHEVGWAKLPVARRVLRMIGRSADKVTYISWFTLARLRGAFGPRPGFVALPSGVDTSFFRPATAQQRAQTRAQLGVGEAPLVVCSSRLVARKGQDQLIRVMPEVRRKAKDARLVIVGSGPYGKRLRALAGDGVLFTGPVSGQRLRDIVAAADVFAMPARTRFGGLDVEGLGIVYLEAQACGVPVIAGSSGGAPETVTPDTGVVVDGRDTSAIADAIVQLLDDDQRRARMGNAGRAHVAEHFSWDVLGDRLAAICGASGQRD